MADISHDEDKAELERWNQHGGRVLLELRRIQHQFTLSAHVFSEDQMKLLSTVNRDIIYIEAQLQAKIGQVEISKGAWERQRNMMTPFAPRRRKRKETFVSM